MAAIESLVMKASHLKTKQIVGILVFLCIVLLVLRYQSTSLSQDYTSSLEQELSAVFLKATPRPTRTSGSITACLQHSCFFWHSHSPDNALTWRYMGMPQFSKLPSGFASRCDWVLGNRLSHYGNLGVMQNMAWGLTHKTPKTVFVRTDLVQIFFLTVMPCIQSKFVLITGDHDVTIPRQLDKRYPKLLSRYVWNQILSDDRIIHIFSEHVDEASPRVTPIPVGINAGEYPGNNGNFINRHVGNGSDIEQRKLKILQIDRVRKGSQWSERAEVAIKCSKEWHLFCDALSTNSVSQWFDLVKLYPFVFCVHGGGIDPNPKAWEVLLMGSIPIIKHFPGDSIYHGLPVVFVDDWSTDTISLLKLRHWLNMLAPYFKGSERKNVLSILTSEHWWNKVQAHLHGREPEKVPRRAIEWRDGPKDDELAGLFPDGSSFLCPLQENHTV